MNDLAITTTSPEDRDTHLRLDDLTLQRHAAGYPDDLREPFQWLGWFVREKCQGDVDALVERARESAIPMDKTNWSKILRGRWNRDAKNNPLPCPVVAQSKLMRFIDQLRDWHRRSEMAGEIPFVMTPTAQSIFNFLDSKRAPGRINRLGVIVGHTGTQKTATLREYCRQHNHGACVWLECPANGSMPDFIVKLGSLYGGSQRDPAVRARRRIIETLRAGVRTVVIDNAQAAYKEKHDAQQPIFNFLREVQEESRACVILSITPEFDKKLTDKMLTGYFEQFEGRAGGRKGFLRLPDHPTEEDCLAFARAFDLQQPSRSVAYLAKLASEPGRVRILLEYLQQAKTDAQLAKEPLTIDHVKALAEDN